LQVSSQSQSQHRELVAFRTADQDFSVDIMSVREIRMWSHATKLPNAPEYVCGVINLRGAVVPIIDLSARLGSGDTPTSDRNVIIIIGIGSKTVGILVEAVFDILSVPQSEIQPPPDLGGEKGVAAIDGLIPRDDGMIRIVNLGRVVPIADSLVN